jgi:hypothetical protein
VLGDLLNESESQCGAGIDVVTAQVERERSLVPEPTRQRPTGADLGDESESPECGHDHRALAGDHQVAGQRPGQTNAGGRTVQRRDEQRVRTCDQARDAPELTTDPPPHVGGALRRV